MVGEEELILRPHPSHRLVYSSPSEFRDATGRHVILDLDGSGSADIAGKTIWEGVDESGRFSEFATASSFEAGAVTSVLLGPSLPDLAEPCDISGSVTGSGWLVAGYAELDGSHELVSPSARFPAPFFRSATGQGKVVVTDDVRWISLCQISISDPESLAMARWRVQNMSEITALDSTFQDGTMLCEHVASHLNEGAFEINLPVNHQGILIEKLGDHFHGRQRARVLVNQEAIGWWSEPVQDRSSRWRWGRFGIGPESLPSSGLVTIGIDPPAGAPLWSVSMYRVFVGVASSQLPQNVELPF